ncbi:MAG: MFS transporter [Deltaproteobacteria bacterium]|nr:MFS transporter [Deltaproteobacteria bacterium]
MITIPYRWKALITVAVGTLMATMDASITNIAFPVFTRVFRTDLTTVIWITLAYILFSTSTMLILGKLSDVVGRKRIYVTGMLLFTMGLTACSVADGIGEMILYRCLQGLGGAMSIACGTAIVTEAFPVRDTGKALGLLGISVSLGFIIGPVLGGFLLHWLDWRSIFYVRAPIAFLSLLLALFLLKRDEVRTGPVSLDLAGALTSACGIFCLVLGISRAKELGILSPLVWGWLIGGLLLILAFTLVERRAKDPVMELSLFGNRTFRNATVALFLTFISAPPFILIMPFYLMQGIGLDPSEAGVLLAVNAMATIVCGPVSGILSDRYGAARFAAAGAAAVTASFLFMLGFDLQTGNGIIVPVMILMGVGIGMFQAPNNSLIMGSVPRSRLGTASALIATLRQVGLSLGMAMAGALYSYRVMIHENDLGRQGLASSEAARAAIPAAFHDTLALSILLGLLVILFSLLRGNGSSGTDPALGRSKGMRKEG